MELEDFFREYPRVAVAFSGGCDSAFLLYAAKKYAREVQAYYVKSLFQPRFELEDARKLAKELGVDMKEIPLDVLEDALVAGNPQNRCYYCKKYIFSAIVKAAAGDGFTILLDGTNASDEEGDRPGMQALRELSVLSPLRLCGLTKEEIRGRSREAGLFTWNKPAYACLATRIPTGQKIDAALLERTERAESFLFSLGFEDFRVRTQGDGAKLQIRESQMPLLLQHRRDILEAFKPDYQEVYLDLEVRDEQ